MSFPPNYDPNWPDIRLKDRLEGSFQDMPSLIEALNSRGMGFQQKDPTLRLSPKEPPRPEVPKMFKGAFGYSYPYQLPEQDPNYIWATDRSNLQGNWYKKGSPVPQEMGYKPDANVFDDSHHGFQFPHAFKQGEQDVQELQNELRKNKLPTYGSRDELFERYIRAQEHPSLKQTLSNNQPLAQSEFDDIVNPAKSLLMEGAEQRAKAPLNAPPNLTQSLERTIGTGSNPMTINNMPQASNLAGAEGSQIARTATQGAATGGAGSMMSRAMPMVGLALQANSMIQNSRANTKRNEEAETERRMET